MKRLPSIRRRLARTVVALTLAWGLGVSGVVWLAVQHEVDEVMDGALQEASEIIFGLLSYNLDRLPLGSGPEALPAPSHGERLVWQIVGPGGAVLLRSHHAPAQALRQDGRLGLGEGDSGTDGRWRVYGLPFPAGPQDPPGRVLYVAQPEAERREARFEAAETTALSVLAVGLLCALLLRRRVGHELQPLRDLSREVARYQPLEPGARLGDAGREELQPLREAVVAMGQCLARRVGHERAFAGHAAHALRTPLAGLVAQLAVAWRESPPGIQPRLARAREAAERLNRVVGALLTLFRSGAEPQLQDLRLGPLVESLAVEGLQVTVQRDGTLRADPDLLAAALINLLDNALRYGASRVSLSLDSPGEACVLRLQDDGPGVLADQRLRLQRALAEDPPEPGSGLGLGLRLAHLVAQAHGGRLELLPDGPGFRLALHLGPGGPGPGPAGPG